MVDLNQLCYEKKNLANYEHWPDNLNISTYNNDPKVYCCNSIYAKDNNSGAGRITFER